LISFVVDEATEFTLKAEPNPSATIRQPSGQGEVSERILTVEVDEVTEFTLPAVSASGQAAGSTCEKDYTEEEIIFMKAMDQYKSANRRPAPTWSEVLEVLRSLGYRKIEAATALPGVPTPPRVQEV
jgi:hypothetical protein